MPSVALIIIALTTIFTGCREQKPEPISKLIERALTESTNPVYNPQLMEGRITELKSLNDSNPKELANALLFVGQTAQAINLLEEKPFDEDSKLLLGVAYMKMAEEQNCVHHHNGRSCLFPLQGSGIHSHQTWALKAAQVFKEIVKKDDSRVDAKWLREVARSATGKTPNLTGARYIKDRKEATDAFQKSQLSPFTNEAGDRSFLSRGWSAGGVFDDFNNDGVLDILTSGAPHQTIRQMPRLQLFQNNGHGRFLDRSKESGLNQNYDGLYFNQTDFNNDGHVDLLVLRGGWSFFFDRNQKGLKAPFSLLQNNGDGTFKDVTVDAGLLSKAPTQAASWADFDGDGYLDLIVGFESTGGDVFPTKLFKNNGDGRFTDVTQSSGIKAFGLIKSVSTGDIDNDGRPDLYIGFADRDNVLYKNMTPSRDGEIFFKDITADAGVAKQTPTFATWFWDYNNDGLLDILAFSTSADRHSKTRAQLLSDLVDYYVSDGRKHDFPPPALFRNKGGGRFEDVTAQVGLDRSIAAMGCNFGDIDNDGFPDIYIGTGAPELSILVPNLMFWNREGQRFFDITFLANVGHLQKGHSVAFGDIDGNGSQDILSVMGGALPSDSFERALFINKNIGNNWIKLRLRGTKSNRLSVGAKVEAIINEQGRRRSVFASVGSGSSFGGNPISQVHIGLGAAKNIEKLTITWPSKSATRSEYHNISANQTLTLVEPPTEKAK
ncbi:MAG: CRTAC1 family protein [Bdellovibrionales bacterium]|nr:CRTAC1 family protein [Bdellovibrionales bacterium]